MIMSNEILLIGDKVLVAPDSGEGMTDAGLYLPQTVKDKDRVSTGKIVKVGPGYPVPDPASLDKEPWAKVSQDKYFPLQAKEGDYCMFLKDQGVEIKFENKQYVVVSHSAILVLVRERHMV